MRFLLPIADGKNAAFLLTGHIHGRLTGSSDLTFLQSSVLCLAALCMRGTEIFRIVVVSSSAQFLELDHLARVSQTLCKRWAFAVSVRVPMSCTTSRTRARLTKASRTGFMTDNRKRAVK
jgi:hypothetical protein